MKTLVFLPESWPLGGVTEKSFIRPEIGELVSAFDRVIIAPIQDCGPLDELPKGVVVDRTLCARPSAADKVRALTTPELWQRAMADRHYIHSFKKLRSAIAFSSYALTYRRRLKKLINHYQLNLNDTLFYTFWFEFQTAALSGIKGTRVITRAHGHDIYDSQNLFLSHSWRVSSLNHILKCFTASEYGANYIRTDYPEYASKVECRSLGSLAPIKLNPDSNSPLTINILSIARVSHEKRVLRVAECVMRWAAECPDLQMVWTHIGDGPEMNCLREIVARTPNNLNVNLLGRMDNQDVHRLLEHEHFDFSVLMSESEGLPIALCESLSYGIPVVATAVGGVPEIVTPDVGLLLSANPTPEEFVALMTREYASLSSRRKAARLKWEREYQSTTLRKSFAYEISRL